MPASARVKAGVEARGFQRHLLLDDPTDGTGRTWQLEKLPTVTVVPLPTA